MSDKEGSDYDEVMYRCKQCPNLTFTAAEKDSHRRMHNEQRSADRRTGSGRRGAREPSPTGTDVTLFLPLSLTPPADAAKPGKGKGRPASGKADKKKVRSRKIYDRGVQPANYDGG